MEPLKGLRGEQTYKDILNTLGEQCFLYTSVKDWIVIFNEGKYSIEDKEQLGRLVSVPTLVNIAAVRSTILSNLRIGLKQISKALYFL